MHSSWCPMGRYWRARSAKEPSALRVETARRIRLRIALFLMPQSVYGDRERSHGEQHEPDGLESDRSTLTDADRRIPDDIHLPRNRVRIRRGAERRRQRLERVEHRA